MAVQTQHPHDQHTYLLAEGTWEAEGTGLLPATGTEAKIIGRTQIRHDGERITNEGWMRVQTLPAFEVQQRYEFRPARRANTWSFVSNNDRVGEMTGEVVFWGPHAMLHYSTAKGRFRGSELMTRVSDTEYTAIGKFTADGRAEIVWSVKLRRVDPPPAD